MKLCILLCLCTCNIYELLCTCISKVNTDVSDNGQKQLNAGCNLEGEVNLQLINITFAFKRDNTLQVCNYKLNPHRLL